MSDINHDNELMTFEAFRPSKRRKLYRKRAEDPADEHISNDPPPNLTSIMNGAAKPTTVSAENNAMPSHIIRQRTTQHRKRAGIEFTNSSVRRESPEQGIDEAPTERNSGAPESNIPDVVSRFAPQTGETMSVDKHM